MSAKRIAVIILIFLLGVAGWLILGSTSTFRSAGLGSSLHYQVRNLWGGPVLQQAPQFYVKVPGSKRVRHILPVANSIKADLNLQHRRKGLLWYSTFTVDFDATYRIKNEDPVVQKVHLNFMLPSSSATYDKFSVWLDEELHEVQLDSAQGIREIIELNPGEQRSLRVSYRTRGLDEWSYQLVGKQARVKNLFMQVYTNFQDVDFSQTSLSPMMTEVLENGTLLTWQADDLLTSQGVGVVMPELVNPGPLSARMSFFAPVCLLFFFVLVTALGVLRRVEIHPMHYLFVTAGFFAFHLLFAYLIDLINVHLAFLLSAGVSLGLVTFYLSNALDHRFPWKWAMTGQFLYLVLFSYSFFLEGMTGLTVTIGSIITLAVLMKLTAKINWGEVFIKSKPKIQTDEG